MPFNMNGQAVTLDLPAINQVLAVATATLHDALQLHLGNVNEDLRQAHTAAHKGDSQQNYLDLCHANTKRTRLVTLATQLAAAIESQFHVNEACKRQDVIVDRPEVTG
jgi:hypothetical protein